MGSSQEVKPEEYRVYGMKSIEDNEQFIEQAAEITTRSHWGSSNVSEEELFNKTVIRLLNDKKISIPH